VDIKNVFIVASERKNNIPAGNRLEVAMRVLCQIFWKRERRPSNVREKPRSLSVSISLAALSRAKYSKNSLQSKHEGMSIKKVILNFKQYRESERREKVFDEINLRKLTLRTT
jgi:hypothetical protein